MNRDFSSDSMKHYQKRVDEWINKFEEGYWSPLAQFAALIEEIGELAKIINHYEKVKPLKLNEVKYENFAALEIEFGDILFSIICLANTFNIELGEAIEKTLSKFDKRDIDRWTLKK
ncbi:MAG: hypothetical protein HeimC3_27180 [Candidatus Heimdallarchaeota archaeon LC_3]|nr:MAG: hypothetical protein HeimC3_27180 [Candidatus Heimdallarchaeota archaeon LC_3]